MIQSDPKVIHIYIHTYFVGRTVERRVRRLGRSRGTRKRGGQAGKIEHTSGGQEKASEAGGDRKKSAGGREKAVHEETHWCRDEAGSLHKQG